MKTLNERIKEVRKNLGLSQKELAEKIGLSQRSVSWGEQPGNNVPDSTIKSLCIVFHINESWLRTGDGSMFVEPDTFSLDQFVRDQGGTGLEIEILKAYFELDKDARLAAVNYFIDRLAAAKAKVAEQEMPSAPTFAPAPVDIRTRTEKPRKEWTDAELHAELDRQLAEQREAAENPPAFWRGRSETA